MPPKVSRKKEKKVAKSKRRQPKQSESCGAGARLAGSGDTSLQKAEAERFFYLALKYEAGDGVEQSDEEAARYYRRAADLGLKEAQHNLGACYKTGKGVPKDFAEAFRWYEMAYKQGCVKALNNLAHAYKLGKGVPPDIKEAVRLFRLAANAGHTDAQFSLGCLFRDGEGVGRDFTESARWFQLAAAQEDAAACGELGRFYLIDGAGVPQDLDEALRLFSFAAAQGYAPALFHLGNMYERGLGVEKNVALAKQYFRRAGKGFGLYEAGSELEPGPTAEAVMKEQLDAIKHTCASCKTMNDNLKVCTRCNGPRYCSVTCQGKDWPEHKLVCQKVSKTEVADRMAQDANDSTDGRVERID